MILGALPPELILHIGDFLSDGSLNALIQTQKWFARLLTPHLYDGKIHFQAKCFEKDDEADRYNLPPWCLVYADRWHSDIILDYFRMKPTHFLTHTDHHGRTLFHFVAGMGNEKLAEILVRKGIDIEAKDKCGITPLLKAVLNQQEGMINWLLNAGANATAVGFYGRTVLEETVLNCSGIMVHQVIEVIKKRWTVNQSSDGDIFAPSTGDRALHTAVLKGDELSVCLFLDYGANVSADLGYGTTALIEAAMYSHENIIHLLLERGADPLPYSQMGASVLTYAADNVLDWNTVQRLFQVVREAGGDITAAHGGLTLLHRFASNGCLPAVELLIKHNANVLACTEAVLTPLHCALANYPKNPAVYEEICRVLIETINRADPDYDHILPSVSPLACLYPMTGGTSLHLAAKYGSETLVRLLLNSRVNILARDDNNHSAFDLASFSGHKTICLLIHDEVFYRQGLIPPDISYNVETPKTSA